MQENTRAVIMQEAILTASSAIAGGVVDAAAALFGPVQTAGFSAIRASNGWNDIVTTRNLAYQLNFRGTDPTPGNVATRGAVRPGPSQLIDAFNKLPWHRFDDNQEFTFLNWWKDLEDGLRYHGIRLGLPDEHVGFNPGQNAFTRLIEFSAGGASFAQVVYEYLTGACSEEELFYNLQKHGLRRKQDRDRIMYPRYVFSRGDALRLAAAEAVPPPDREKFLTAAGLSSARDRRLVTRLASPQERGAIMAQLYRRQIDEAEAHRLLAMSGVIDETTRDAIISLRYKMPSPESALSAVNKDVFNEVLARKYGMDDGIGDAAIARWVWEAQGASEPGAGIPRPGQNSGDWFRVAWRATRFIPEYPLAFKLQHRLRPSGNNDGMSYIPGVPEWTADNTRDMLGIQNMPDDIAKRMLALAYEPINIRLINHILGPFATHPEVRAAAAAAFGEGVDWVERAMLDHGFSPAYAKVASVGIHAQADDREFSELKSNQKSIKVEIRKAHFESYRLGTVEKSFLQDRVIDDQFTNDEVNGQCEAIDAEVANKLDAARIKTLHEAWMTGKLDATTIGQQLAVIVTNPERHRQYIETWIWERGEKVRMLNTGEILGALKSGLMPPAVAQARLVNLGWNAADALIEVAQVEHGLAVAQARTQAATANHLAAVASQARTAHENELRAAAKAAAQEAKKNERIAREVAISVHEKLLAQSQYYAGVHAANKRYAAALAKNDQETMAAEVAKDVSAYEQYLIKQLDLYF